MHRAVSKSPNARVEKRNDQPSCSNEDVEMLTSHCINRQLHLPLSNRKPTQPDSFRSETDCIEQHFSVASTVEALMLLDPLSRAPLRLTFSSLRFTTVTSAPSYSTVFGYRVPIKHEHSSLFPHLHGYGLCSSDASQRTKSYFSMFYLDIQNVRNRKINFTCTRHTNTVGSDCWLWLYK